MPNPLNAPMQSSPYENASGEFPGTNGLSAAWDALRNWFTRGATTGWTIMQSDITSLEQLN